jgi:hypothetical protein
MASGPLREARRAFDPLRHGVPDDDPAASSAGLDQTLLAERRQRATERVPRDAETGAELAFGREATARQEAAGQDVGLDPAKDLHRREIVAVDIASACGGLVGALTLIHRWSTLAPMKLAAPEGGASRGSADVPLVASASGVARSDEVALYDAGGTDLPCRNRSPGGAPSAVVGRCGVERRA